MEGGIEYEFKGIILYELCYFKLNNVLSIISYSVDKEKYELDFAMFEYDSINEQQYKKAITEGYADVWKKDGIDEEI